LRTWWQKEINSFGWLEMVVVSGQERLDTCGNDSVWYVGCVWLFPQSLKISKILINSKKYILMGDKYIIINVQIINNNDASD